MSILAHSLQWRKKICMQEELPVLLSGEEIQRWATCSHTGMHAGLWIGAKKKKFACLQKCPLNIQNSKHVKTQCIQIALGACSSLLFSRWGKHPNNGTIPHSLHSSGFFFFATLENILPYLGNKWHPQTALKSKAIYLSDMCFLVCFSPALRHQLWQYLAVSTVAGCWAHSLQRYESISLAHSSYTTVNWGSSVLPHLI